MKRKIVKALLGAALLSLSLSACNMLPMGGASGDNNNGGENQDFTRGASMHTGRGKPADSLGEVGDLYLDLSTYELYLKTDSGWVLNGSLKGSDGKDGQDGKDGSNGRDGKDGTDAQYNDSGLVFYALNDFEYAVGMGTAQYLVDSIVIPNEFEGKPVTQIADNGFKDSNLTSVTIPSSINAIGAHAFENCVNLQSLSLPNSVNSVGEKAFAGCTSLRTVSLGNVSNIGNYAFGNCTNLQSVNLPSTLWIIGEGAFYGCSRLSTVNYGGTQNQWQNISAGQYWYVGTRVKLITCTDGSFNINIYNEEVLTSLDYCYHAVGGYEKNWTPNKDDVMEPTSIKEIYNLDNKLGSKLSEKDIEHLYKRQITIGTRLDEHTTKTIYKEKVRQVSNSYTIRVSQSSYDIEHDKYVENVFIPDNGNFNNRNKAEALTNNIFIPAYQSEPDANGFSWANLPVMNVQPGSYIFVMAKYANVNSWSNNAGYGFGLIVVNGGDMITNDPFEEEIDPNEPAKTYTATYLNDDDSVFATSSANTIAELASYDKNIPTKDAAGATQYAFREWELKSREENALVFKAKFEGCTRGLVFRDNVVYQYTGMAKEVEIPSRWEGKEITTISNRCFQATDVESVIIPDSIVRIENQAFESCKKLTSIVIPDSVTFIDYSAFYNCESLENVTLSGNLTRISSSLFNNCKALKQIELPQRIAYIEDNAFNNCTSLTSIVIPDTVTSINSQAFNNCTKLESVEFSSSLTSIGWNAFYNCYSLKSLSLPEGLLRIDSYAFQSCRGLTTIDIPNTVTNIGSYAFSDCGDLIIRMASESKPKDFDSNWGGDSTIIYGYVSTITVDGFTYILSKREDYQYANLVDFNVDGVTEFVAPAEVNGYALASINLKPFKNNVTIRSVDFSNCSSLTTIGKDAFSGCVSLESVILPDSITTIGNRAFYNCASLKSIVIPDNVTSIGSEAFKYCYSLTAATFGENSKLKTLSSYAFQNCNSLESIVIPSGVSTIEYQTFENCYALNNVKLNEGLVTLAGYCFRNCRSLPYIVIPDSVTTINYDVFWNCQSLCSVTIGKNVTTIDSNAFNSCGNLLEVINKSALLITPGNSNYGYVASNAKQVVSDPAKSKLSINNGFVTYNDGATVYLVGYQGNEDSIVIPNNVTRIKQYAFYGRSMHSVTISASVTQIDQHAFENCYKLHTVTFLGDYPNADYYAFGNCYNLVEFVNKGQSTGDPGYEFHRQSVSYQVITSESQSKLNTDANGFVTYNDGNNVWLIGYEGNASDIVIPNNVTRISNYAFYNCAFLKTVSIPTSVIDIRSNAFYGCDYIQQVFYDGSAQDWMNINLEGNNSYAMNNSVYYYSESEPAYIGLYWHYVNGVKTPWAMGD